TVSPIHDANGKIIGASKVARDITRQRREQERTAVTLASIADAVISTDEHGCVVFLNPVAEQLTGWPKAEAIGRGLDEVFQRLDPTTRTRIESPVATLLKSGSTAGVMERALLVARDGV